MALPTQIHQFWGTRRHRPRRKESSSRVRSSLHTFQRLICRTSATSFTVRYVSLMGGITCRSLMPPPPLPKDRGGRSFGARPGVSAAAQPPKARAAHAGPHLLGTDPSGSPVTQAAVQRVAVFLTPHSPARSHPLPVFLLPGGARPATKWNTMPGSRRKRAVTGSSRNQFVQQGPPLYRYQRAPNVGTRNA
jgi:hypothetical protein